jgi:predicted branched-subunit amino acid permease
MTGVAMVKSGMSVFEAVAMTMLVFAGSSQLAAIPLLVAGAPAWVILATGFCVNLRFVVFSLHLQVEHIGKMVTMSESVSPWVGPIALYGESSIKME